MLGTILTIILILLLIGALPTWGYSSGWGYYPGGGLGIILIIVIILVLMDEYSDCPRAPWRARRSFLLLLWERLPSFLRRETPRSHAS